MAACYDMAEASMLHRSDTTAAAIVQGLLNSVNENASSSWRSLTHCENVLNIYKYFISSYDMTINAISFI